MSPAAQAAHTGSTPRIAQCSTGMTTTRRAPTSATTSATISCPNVNGKLTIESKYAPACPLTVARSLPQMPDIRGRRRSHSGPGNAGSSPRTSSSGPAFAAVVGATAESTLANPIRPILRSICNAFIDRLARWT